MKTCMMIVLLLLSCVSNAVAIDVRTTRTLESMQMATSAAALTSFFLVDMVPAEYKDAMLATSFSSQLAHSATSVALVRHKRNKAAVLRILFPVAALFSFIKLSAVLYDNRLEQPPALQTDLLAMGQEVADSGQQELVLAAVFATSIAGQCGMLCYDCLSTES